MPEHLQQYPATVHQASPVPYRSPIFVAIITYITSSAYMLYWLIATKRKLNQNNHRVRVPSGWHLASPLVPFVLGIVALTLIYSSAPLQDSGASDSSLGVPAILAIVAAILSTIASIFYCVRWLYIYCQAVEEYTAGHISTVLGFILIWLLGAIGLAIIQDSFNKRLSAA